MDSRISTYEHIQLVQTIMSRAIQDLQQRQLVHDQSKLASPEIEVFDEFTPKLASTVYGSDEYKKYLSEMKKALDHHYAENDHHPEHHTPPGSPEIDNLKKLRDELEFGPYAAPCVTAAVACMDNQLASMKSPIRQMNLVSLLEMLCDWVAATHRHATGDIRKSIEINQRRFGYSDELKQILLNTLPALDQY